MDPYVGEIRMFGGNFAPNGWMTCDGQLLPINQNQALFSLLGTTYGGDGQNTFGLPDLQGRLPVHQGNESGQPSYNLGQSAGGESVTLILNQIPQHTHTLTGSSNAAVSRSLAGNVPATSTRPVYGINATTNLGASALPVQGGSQPHENRQPFSCVTFIISLFGVYPSQN